MNRGGRHAQALSRELGNPKAVVFFGSILPHAFDMSSLSAWEAALVIALGVGLDLAVQSTYVAAAARARLLFRPERLRIVNRSAAILMTSAAALIAVRT